MGGVDILKYKIAVVGGDERQQAAKTFFEVNGHCVTVLSCGEAPDFIDEFDFLLLPIPFSASAAQFETCVRAVKKGGAIFGAAQDGEKQAIVAAAQAKFIDILSDEPLAIANAALTAQAALKLILGAHKTGLTGQTVLVAGYGRIAKILCGYLKALGANVTVAARSAQQRAWAGLAGCCAVEPQQLCTLAPTAQTVVNTAPHLVIDCGIVKRLNKTAYVLDLASPPGGVDLVECAVQGIKAEWARGLPAKFAPVAAGELMAQAALKLFEAGQ